MKGPLWHLPVSLLVAVLLLGDAFAQQVSQVKWKWEGFNTNAREQKPGRPVVVNTFGVCTTSSGFEWGFERHPVLKGISSRKIRYYGGDYYSSKNGILEVPFFNSDGVQPARNLIFMGTSL